jgi:hypothetical protein
MSSDTILDANRVAKSVTYNETTAPDYKGFKLAEMVLDSTTHNAVIVDISSTIAGTFYYYSTADVSGEITTASLPFLISDKKNNADLSCNIYFVPLENKDGEIKIRYFRIGDDSLILTSPDLSYNIFNTMSVQKYIYYKNNDGSYVLSTNPTTTDLNTYLDGIGIPVLNVQNSVVKGLYTTYTELGLALNISPINQSIYDVSENYYYNSNNYYRVPDVVEDNSTDGTTKSYAIAPAGTTQYMVDYNVDPSGAIYTLSDYLAYKANPAYNRTRIILDVNGSYTTGNTTITFIRLENQITNDDGVLLPMTPGVISSQFVFYDNKLNSIYTPLELKITHTHSNNAPIIENNAEIIIKNGTVEYNQDTAANVANNGRSISSIITDVSLNYLEFNTLYDGSGLAFQNPDGDISGAWNYKIGTSGSWNQMLFVNPNPVWYFSTKNGTNEIYIKFTPTENKTGTATIEIRGWDLTEGYEINNNPKVASLLPTGGSSSLSNEIAILKQPIVKVNRAPVINSGTNNTITTAQDTDLIIDIDGLFLTSTIGFTDESGPARGVVITDICGGDLGTWYYGVLPFGSTNVSAWTTLTGGGLHIKEFDVATANIRLKFTPKKYRYGNVTMKIRGWDQYVDVPNGTFAAVALDQIGGYGTYSSQELMFNIAITNTRDAPVFVNNNGVEVSTDISGLYATYQQGFTPATPLSEGTISIGDILTRFNTIFGCNIKTVENDGGLFTDYGFTGGVPNLGIVIDEITTATDLSSVALMYDNGGWNDISANNIKNGSSLFLTNTNNIGFKVPMMFKGDNALQIRFRVWDLGNQSTINQRPAFELQTATGNFYSLPVTLNFSYSDANDAPVIDINSSFLEYTFDISQNEGTIDGRNLSLIDLVDDLIALESNGVPIIKDLDGDYSRIPKFGFAFYGVGETPGFSEPGVWKYRRIPNGVAAEFDMSGGAFHICAKDNDNPQIYFEPANKNVYGTVQLRGYLWDRSNIIDADNGTVPNYSKAVLPAQRGLLTAYSIKPVYLNYIINPVNDRPIVTRGALRLAPIANNNYDSSGQSLYEIMRLNNFLVEDPDPTDLGKHGIAITAVCSPSFGIWQYSTTKVSGIYNWQDIPDNSTNALHLDPILNDIENENVRIRFVPNSQRTTNRVGVRMFQYLVWDKNNDAENGDFITINNIDDNSYSLIVYNGRISLL